MNMKRKKVGYCRTGKGGVLLMHKGDEVHHEHSGVIEDCERTHGKLPACGYFRARCRVQWYSSSLERGDEDTRERIQEEL